MVGACGAMVWSGTEGESRAKDTGRRSPPGIEHPAPLTRADIERWLIAPMRALRDTSIVALPGNALEPVASSRPSATFDSLAFARTVLGKDTPELRAVTTWARIMAADGHAEASIAEWCALFGWKERTFYHRLRRGLDRIVKAKNHADGRLSNAA